jgi:hypothetical protein
VLAPYGMSWTLKGGKLAFDGLAGASGLMQWTLKPYQTIS